MIDLTPLEVRKKKGDFRRAMRGYDPALVDDFLDLVADRLDELVRQNLSLSERVATQEQQVTEYRDRERALTEALVTAQEMREEIRRQAAQEAELARRGAEQEIVQLRSAAEQDAERLSSAVQREASQLRLAAQQETSELRARVQQEVAELRTALRQEREREEEALRVLRARQQQFVTAYRTFLEGELNELGGITRALGLAAPPDEPPPHGGGRNDSTSGGMGAAAAGLGLAGPGAAAGSVQPDRPEGGPVGGVEARHPTGGDELALAVTVFTEEIVLEQAEPFEPEPFEPESLEQQFNAPAVLATDRWESMPGGGAASAPHDDDDLGLSPSEVDDEAAGFVDAGGGTIAEEDSLEPYDGLSAGGADAGVPGPVGLGGTWSGEPSWPMEGVDLAPADSEAGGPVPEERGADAEPPGRAAGLSDASDSGEADADEDVDQLLRNAAAAGYALEDLDAGDELLLDDPVETDDDDSGDGWLPDLLRDEQ
jgi:cell division initiation protein